MSSTLERQMAALRQANRSIASASGDGRQRASLLMDSRKAADVDIESIYRVASAALDDLCDCDSAFLEFRESLFSEESKHLSRELQTQDVNDRIDASIAQYLRMLSPLYPTAPAQQTLEYLIRRYSVHVFCVDAVTKCILPYHDTEAFVRMVSLLQLDGSAWSFLKVVQSSKSAVPRNALVQKCLRDKGVLRLILAVVDEAWQAGTLERHVALLAFYGAFMLELLEKMGPVHEDAMRLLLPLLMKAVRTPKSATEYKVASYMILSKMCSSTALSPKVSSAVLLALADGLDASAAPQCLGAIAAVVHSQSVGSSGFPVDALRIVSAATWGPALMTLSATAPPAANVLLPVLLQALAAAAASGVKRVGQTLLGLLEALRPVPAMSRLVPVVIVELARRGAAVADGEPEMGASAPVRELLNALKEREEAAYQTALQRLKGNVEQGSEDDRGAYELLASGTPQTPVAVGLSADHTLGLVEPDAKGRVQALSRAVELWGAGKEGPSWEVVHACLLDDDHHVVMRAAADDVVGHLVKRAGVDEVAGSLTRVLDRWFPMKLLIAGAAEKVKVKSRVLKVVKALLGAAGEVWRTSGGVNGTKPGRSMVELLAMLLALLPRVRGNDKAGEAAQSSELMLPLQRYAVTVLGALKHPIVQGLSSSLVDGLDEVALEAHITPILVGNIKAHVEQCDSLIRVALEKHHEGLLAAFQANLLCWVARATQVPADLQSAPSSSSITSPGGKRRRCKSAGSTEVVDLTAESRDSTNLASMVLPPLLQLLAQDTPAKAAGPRPCTLVDLTKPLSSLIASLPAPADSATVASQPDAALKQLLGLPPHVASQWGVSEALQVVLARQHGAQALAALSEMFVGEDREDTADESCSFSQVHALGVAATLADAVRASGDAGALQRFVYNTLEVLVPNLIVALCSGTKRVREGAFVLLSVLFPPDGRIERAQASDIGAPHVGRNGKREPTIARERRNGMKGPTSTAGSVNKDSLARQSTAVELLAGLLHRRRALLLMDGANSISAVREALREGADAVNDSDSPTLIESLVKMLAAAGAAASGVGDPASRVKAQVLLELAFAEPLVSSTIVMHEVRSFSLPSLSWSAPVQPVRDLCVLLCQLRQLSDHVKYMGGRPRQLLVMQLTRHEEGLLEGDALELFMALLGAELEGRVNGVDGLLGVLARQEGWAVTRLSAEQRKNKLWSKLMDALVHADQTGPKELGDLIRSALVRIVDAKDVVKGLAEAVHSAVKTKDDGAARAKLLTTAETVQFTRSYGVRNGWRDIVEALVQAVAWAARPPIGAPETNGDGPPVQGASSGMEFLMMLLLETLTDIVGDQREDLEPDVDVILDLLEGTTSLSVRNAALKLVAVVSSVSSSCRIASMRRMLDWLGKESVAEEDPYSFTLVLKVLNCVIPRVMANGGDAGNMMLSLCQGFVDAYSRIPPSRRLRLYEELVQSMGESSLGLLAHVMLAKGNVLDGEDREGLTHLSKTLFIRASEGQQLLSMADLLELVRVAMDVAFYNKARAEERVVRLRRREDSMDEGAEGSSTPGINVNSITVDLDALGVGEVAVEAIQLVTRCLLESERARRHQTQQRQQHELQEDTPESQRGYLLLCEELMLLLRQPRPKLKPVVKLFDDVRALARALLDNVQGCLSIPAFVTIVQELLRHDDLDVRRKALQMLHTRLTQLRQRRRRLSRGEQHLVMELLPDLLRTVDPCAQTNPGVQQAAWACIAALADCFGVPYAKHFLPVFDHLAVLVRDRNSRTEAEGRSHLIASALVCAASTCHVMGVLSLPKLSRLVPSLLDIISGAAEPSAAVAAAATATELSVKDAALSSLAAVIASVPNFLHPFLPRILRCLLDPGPGVSAQGLATIERAQALIAMRIPARLLLPVVFSLYRPSVEMGGHAVMRLVGVLSTALRESKRGDVLHYMAQLTQFYLLALDFRNDAHDAGTVREGGDGSGLDIDVVDEAVCLSFLELVLRLNEDELKPLFLSVAHWKTAGGPQRPRRLIFYRVLGHLVEKLRTIFVPFFGHVWSDIAADLQLIAARVGQDADAEDKEGGKASKTKKRKRSTSGEGEEVEQVGWEGVEALVRGILSALHKCFQYDEDGFLTPQRFEAMMPRLTGLITGLRRGIPGAGYRVLAEAYLVPAIGQMACAAGKDVLWKPLNHQLLMRTRENDWEVRLVALKALQQCFTAVGEEYLAMLPESISFLSELLEDEHPEVVAVCKATVTHIEQLSGESLESYLS